MKHLLDREKTLNKLDSGHVYDSITMFPSQLKNAWEEINIQTIKKRYQKIQNICITGMGGSALAGRIIHYLNPTLSKLSIQVSSNYRLPTWVNKNTLVIASSYSGNTEEIISSTKDAIERGSKIFIITSGGQLQQLATQKGLDIFLINPNDNPSGKPRLALGSSLGAHLGFLSRIKLINNQNLDINSITDSLHSIASKLTQDIPSKNNPAKILAIKTKHKAVIIFSANHLNGSAYASKNQINESAKTFSTNFILPELNHHLLEGLSLPQQLKQYSYFILLNSNLYPQRIQKRLKITQEVLQKQKYPLTIIKPESSSMLQQALETIYFFEYFSFYLAMVNGVNPAPIPWVDYFKKKLASPL